MFNLYINDLLNGLEGVSVPGLSENISGLLFADDAVVLAEDQASLKRDLEKVREMGNGIEHFQMWNDEYLWR